ncbi:40S ribosomal protein S17 [Podochytrium sp. JEL0797]|nr:40S ribosomal protein S17 [Podochytrium sp. JEL0797]
MSDSHLYPINCHTFAKHSSPAGQSWEADADMASPAAQCLHVSIWSSELIRLDSDSVGGRVRTKTVKKASRVLIEKYYPRLTLDFQTNKRIADEVAIIASKRLRNKIAGFTTHLMKRIQKGPVRGISFKLQEEERERKDQYIPEVSALAVETIEVDPETAALLKALNFENLPGVQVVNPQTAAVERVPGFNRGPRKD